MLNKHSTYLYLYCNQHSITKWWYIVLVISHSSVIYLYCLHSKLSTNRSYYIGKWLLVVHMSHTIWPYPTSAPMHPLLIWIMFYPNQPEDYNLFILHQSHGVPNDYCHSAWQPRVCAAVVLLEDFLYLRTIVTMWIL